MDVCAGKAIALRARRVAACSTAWSAVLRANRTDDQVLPAELKFHALRHTYASLCIAAGRPPLEIARLMGHAKVTTTLGVYAHVFATDDHADAMAALGVMEAGPQYAENVVSLWVS